VAPYGCGAVNTDLAQAIVPCGDQLDAHGVAPDHQPIAVMLDLVNPIGAGRRTVGRGREAWLDKTGGHRPAYLGGQGGESSRPTPVQAPEAHKRAAENGSALSECWSLMHY
jgi:hypothetical protein